MLCNNDKHQKKVKYAYIDENMVLGIKCESQDH